MASVVSSILDACNTQAQSVAGLSSSTIFQGKKRFLETDNFENLVRASTAETAGYLMLYPGERESRGQIEVGTLQVIGELFVCVPKDTTTTMDNAFSFVESVTVALQQESAFYGLGCRPISCKYKISSDEKLEEGFVVFDIDVVFEAGVIGGSL